MARVVNTGIMVCEEKNAIADKFHEAKVKHIFGFFSAQAGETRIHGDSTENVTSFVILI